MNDNYLEILEQYDGEFPSVRRGRGAWLCEWNGDAGEGKAGTGAGDICKCELRLLREYRGTIRRLEFEEEVLENFSGIADFQVDQYIRNKENSLVTIAGDGTKFVMKRWFADRECNLRDGAELLRAVRAIAKLHRALRAVGTSGEWTLGSIRRSPVEEELLRHNRELRRARTYISGKRKKTEFELCVMQNFSAFYEQALEAQTGLKQLAQAEKQNRLFLCHGELNQHYILMGNEYVAFTDFNNMHLGDQMEDLYYFLRKVLEKQSWNERLGLSLLDAYDAELPLSDGDRRRLYYLFLYPEKYWKQINFYYNTNKAWIPEKNVEKLKNLEAQESLRRHFLTSFLHHSVL